MLYLSVESKRSIDPPEMETNQLLLVSSIGLFINLWGMYATGGHHHHGHSHGHSHTIEVNEKKVGISLISPDMCVSD